MKAISIQQPWLNAIVDGRKSLEIRTWKTSYRGPLLLVASKVPQLMPGQIANSNETAMYLMGLPVDPLGMAVAVCKLVNVRPMTIQDEPMALCQWHYNQRPLMAFELADVRKLPMPFPVKGRLSIYDVEGFNWPEDA